jgi:4-methylaminobutanoate oxidase (formaldehyde-forming)
MENALLRIPALHRTGIRKMYNGPESFTPDNQFVLGEAPEVAGFFVGAGFNSVGIACAGGAGRALAEWIVEGEPSTDLTSVDIRRFAPFNGNTQWLHDRVAEILGLHYEIPWPNREMRTARPFRRSPVYHLLREANANFGSRMGWERANFFAPQGESPEIEYSWGKQNWLPWSAEEQVNTRENVTVFDQTSFSKLRLVGPGRRSRAPVAVHRDVAVPVGRTVYTGMLNERGTYESDVTLTRLAEDDYLIVSSAATTERDKDWIRRRIAPGPAGHARRRDVAYAVFGVMGPRSRELLSRLTRSDISDDAFPFGASRELDLGHSTVRATRITYVGELGWELYVPVEFAVGVYEDLMRTGADLGVVNGGYYAIESMRLEKGYRAFGRELTPDHGPLEAGLMFTCKLKSDLPFLGREALEKARAAGPQRRLVSFVVESAEPMLWGGELVLRDGHASGQVTSAAWGATLGRCVGLAYLWDRDGGPIDLDWIPQGSYQVDVGGTRVPVTVTTTSPYDPDRHKLRL